MSYINGKKVLTICNTTYVGDDIYLDAAPKGVDTSTNILAFTEDKGIYVGSDTGHWYYWNGTQYAQGGLYIANIDDTNNDISQLQGLFNYYDILTLKLELGSIVDGVDVSSTLRARTKGSIIFANENFIITNNSYKLDIFYYDEYGAYLSQTGWITPDVFVIEKNKYFRLLISKNDNSTITSNELNEMFKKIKIFSFDIREIKNNVKYNTNSINIKQIVFELGNVDTSTGEDVPSNFRARSNLFIPNNNLKLYLPYDMALDYYKNNRWYGLGWNTNGYLNLEKGVPCRIVLRKDINNSVFSDYDILKINSSYRVVLNNDEVENVTILDYSTISKYETEFVSHCSMGVIKDGICYVAYYGDDVDEIESFTNLNTKIRFSKFNLCNPSNNEIIDVAKVGDTYGSIEFNSQSPYDPNLLLLNNDVLIYFRPYYNSDEHIVIRKYDIENNILSNDIIECKLIYNNNSYDFSRQNVINIYNDVLETNYDIYTIIFTSHIVNYNNEYYALISSESPENNNFGGILVKSSDGINWNVVKCFESTSRSMEMDLTITSSGLAYISERIYQSSNANIFTYDIVNDVVSSKKLITNNADGKTNMVKIHDDIYFIHNVPNSFIAKGNVYRSKLAFDLVDNKLNTYNVRNYLCYNGVHYPCLINYNNVNYMLFTSDKKEVSKTYDRSNIGILSIKNLGD